MDDAAKTHAKNKTYIANGIIWLVQVGPQNKATITAQRVETEALVAQQKAAGQPIRVVADLSQVTHADSGARLEAKAFLDTEFAALAIVGNKYLQPIVAYVLKMRGKTQHVRYFSNRQEALNWLQHKTPKGHKPRLSASILLIGAIGVMILLTLGATIYSWRQAIDRTETLAQRNFGNQVEVVTDALGTRAQAYSDTLFAFRSLFHSSDTVSEKEFLDYFSSLEIQKKYPGFNAISYIAAVPRDKIASFTAKIRSDQSVSAQSNANFTIRPNSNRPEAFVATYIAGSQTTTGKGVDIGSTTERQELVNQARKSGQPTATDTLKLLDASGKESANSGFLLSLPIYDNAVPSTEAERIAQNEGFVHAIFNYKILFGDALPKLPDNLRLRITDSNGEEIFATGPAVGANWHTSSQSLQVANQTWQLEAAVPPNFQLSREDANRPQTILFSGFILTLLLTSLLVVQARSRSRALDLAAAITEDLEQERNAAVAIKNKDEAILESIGDGVFALDRDGNIVLFNKAAGHISGFTANEALGKPFDEILKFRDESGQNDRYDFIAQAQQGQLSHMDARTMLVRKDGELLPVADSAAPIFDASGQQQGVIIVFRDISEEEKAKQALEASNKRFELVSTATSDIIYDMDTHAGSIWWNEALYTEYGFTPAPEVQTIAWWSERIHPDDVMRVNEEISRLLYGRQDHWESEYRFQRADGSYAHVRDRAFVLRDTKGEPTRLIGSLLDITKQKDLERTKDEFISLVSHQLRTPLTAIRLFTEMLDEGQVGELTADQKSYVEKIGFSTERMITLVRDILNVSRIELGRIKVEPIPTDVEKLILAHVDEAAALAKPKKIRLEANTEGGLPKIPIDPTVFEQVIHNLLTNAIRYTPEGGKVTLHFKKGEDGYILSVSDTGIGIPQAAQSRIFERFYRAENAKKIEGEGTGLGLYLIRIIMQSVGGKVWFESTEGKGTTFFVHLPPTGMQAKEGEKKLG